MYHALCNRWVKLASCICVALQDWRLTKVLEIIGVTPLLLSKNVKSSIQIKRNENFFVKVKKLVILPREKHKFVHLEDLFNPPYLPHTRRHMWMFP